MNRRFAGTIMVRSNRCNEVRMGVKIADSLSLLLLLLLFGIIVPLPAAAQNLHNNQGSENPYMEAKLTPSMAIIIVVLIAAMFIMGFFSIYIRHCNNSGASSGSNTFRAVAAGRSRRARGITADALSTMPTFAYSEVKNIQIGKGGALECAVCLNEFDDDDTLRLLPICDHVFHSECIDIWLASHTTCPVCRANLEEPHAVSVTDFATGEPNPPYDLPVTVSVAVPENDSDPNTSVPVPENDSDLNTSVPATQLNSPGSVISNPSIPKPVIRNPSNRRSVKKPRFPSKFPRSHSTGHSLVQPGENCERFTLRLPLGVRNQLINRSMNRAAGMAMLPREGSSKGGYRTGGEGSSRGARLYRRLDSTGKSDRWGFSAPFFNRAMSLRSPRVAADAEGSWSSLASSTPRAILTAVKAPLNCLGSKGDEGGTSSSAQSARLPV